jgi:hypothetical protein
MLDSDILRRPCPLVYELEPSQRNDKLIIGIHERVLPYASSVLNRSDVPVIRGLRESLKLGEFSDLNSSSSLGFEEIFQKIESSKEGILRYETALASPDEHNWRHYHKISASLRVLFKVLGSYKLDPNLTAFEKGDQQLMTFDNVINQGEFNGGALEVKIAPPMCDFLATLPPTDEEVITRQVLYEAYGTMVTSTARSPLDRYRFRVTIVAPYLVGLHCPGNTTYLAPEDRSPRPGQGYTLESHNVDSSVQQLTLMMGVASLHKRAREANF